MENNFKLGVGDSAVVIREDGTIEIAVVNGEEEMEEGNLAETCPSMHLALSLASATSDESLMELIHEHFEELMERINKDKGVNWKKLSDKSIPSKKIVVDWDAELKKLKNDK